MTLPSRHSAEVQEKMAPVKCRLVSLLVFALALGCSDVETDPEGTGGTASSGGDGGKSSGSGAGKQDASSSSTSSGVVDPATICEEFCEATGSCYSDCAAVCQSYREPPCEAEGLAYLGCLVKSFDAATCSLDGCDVLPLFMCRSTYPADCQPETCGGGATSCACTRECTGGQQKTVCVMQGDNAACTCYVSSLPFATWSGPAELVDGCSFEGGPCAFLSGAQ